MKTTCDPPSLFASNATLNPTNAHRKGVEANAATACAGTGD
jgi:hypothetical protein